MSARTTLLLVDDDPNNLEILENYLEDAGYQCVTARQGKEGLDILKENPQRFQALLLDRMMPEMDGMELLGQIKSDSAYINLPVILQTAAASPKEIQEGIDAGAFYYITKPFNEEVLLSVVNSAVRDFLRYEEFQTEVDHSSAIFEHLHTAEFYIQTLDHANALAANLSRAFPNPHRVVTGLIELLLNAIEHGNLGISYEEKTELVKKELWEAEIASRLRRPENSKKQVCLKFHKHSDYLEVIIQDEGPGFDWKRYFDTGMDLGCLTHGRGIALAKLVSFDTLEYLGAGNVVRATVSLCSSTEYSSHQVAEEKTVVTPCL